MTTIEQLLEWAKQRKAEEVDNRPDENIYKRTLSETWDQVIRKLTETKQEEERLSKPDPETGHNT